MKKIYDRAYFDKWYRDEKHRVGSRDALKRKVAFAVAMAEFYLGREIRNVLDAGCGEGARLHIRSNRGRDSAPSAARAICGWRRSASSGSSVSSSAST